MRLQGKTAIVTGGGSGIGREIARVFAHEGAAVAIADIDPATATATAAQIQHDGGRAISLQVDVTEETHVQRMVSEVLEAFGTTDVLVNNAGVNAYATTIDTSLETWNWVMRVNLTGAFLCAKHVIPVMKKGGRGAIVNIASLAGLVGGAAMAAYTASKGGLTSFTKALAIDHGSEGIRANCICPSIIEAPMLDSFVKNHPDPNAARQRLASTRLVGRIGRPEDVAYAALYLASEEASYVTGAVLVVDGGRR